jgi:uncharacterized membrane protein
LAIRLSVLVGVLSVVLVLYSCLIGAQGSAAAATESVPTREEMRRFILWRSFYVNPDDPRGWVPKTWGYGWTVNFRSRRTAVIFAQLLGATAVAAIGLVIAAVNGV